jgi:Tfp pilus assembly protein PilF
MTSRSVGLRSCLLAWAVVAAILIVPGCRNPAIRQAAESPGAPEVSDPPPEPLDNRGAADVQFAVARTTESSDPAAAVALYEEVLKLDPDRHDAHLRLAILHDRRGDFAASAPHYEAALKARPDDPEWLCDRGYSLYLQGRTEEAERLLRRAIAVKPDCARARNNLGLLLGRQGRSDEAIAQFAAAGGSAADCQTNLAFAMAVEGRLDEARASYAGALAAEPGSEIAAKGLASLEKSLARGAAPADPATRRAAGPAAPETGGPP